MRSEYLKENSVIYMQNMYVFFYFLYFAFFTLLLCLRGMSQRFIS